MGIDLIKHSDAVPTDAKRLKAPYTLVSKCESCGIEVLRDLADDHYLSYPVTDKPFRYTFYCAECGVEWDFNLVFRITIEEVV